MPPAPVGVLQRPGPPEYFRATGNSAGATRCRPDANVVILLTLDTHAGDLRAFDPGKGVVLRNNRG